MVMGPPVESRAAFFLFPVQVDDMKPDSAKIGKVAALAFMAEIGGRRDDETLISSARRHLVWGDSKVVVHFLPDVPVIRVTVGTPVRVEVLRDYFTAGGA
jgi:hypothetical protein